METNSKDLVDAKVKNQRHAGKHQTTPVFGRNNVYKYRNV